MALARTGHNSELASLITRNDNMFPRISISLYLGAFEELILPQLSVFQPLWSPIMGTFRERNGEKGDSTDPNHRASLRGAMNQLRLNTTLTGTSKLVSLRVLY